MLLDPDRPGRESEADDLRNSLSLKSKSRASHDFNPIPCNLKSCGDGRGEAAGVDTLEAVVTNLHTGGPGHRVALYWTKAAVDFGSPPGV